MASNTIRANISPEVLEAQPGSNAPDVVLSIQNTGAAVDQYTVQVDSLPAEWYNLSRSGVALFPGDKDEAHLTIRPPKDARAGKHDYRVVVTSLADGSYTEVPATLIIRAKGDWTVDVSPKQARGRTGRYKVLLGNGLNDRVTISLSAADSEGKCRFKFSETEVSLAPNQAQSEVNLRVTAKRSGLLGKPKQFDFEIKARSDHGDTKPSVQAQFEHKPWIKSLAPVRKLIVPLLLLALILASVTIKPLNDQLNIGLDNLRQGRCTNVSSKPFFCDWKIPLLLSLFGDSSAQPPPHIPKTGRGLTKFRNADLQLVGEPESDEVRVGPGLTEQVTTTGLLIYARGVAYFVPQGGGRVYEFTHGHVFPHDNNAH
jgi:hypothetical protein